MQRVRWHLFAFGFVAAFAGFCILLALAGRLFEPNMETGAKEYTKAEIEAARKARDTSFDPKNPPVIQRDVDYSEGKNGKWYPKGEAPILAELVKEGKLPPLEERMPEEPVVLEGVDGIGKYGGTWLRVANSPGDVGVITWRLSYSSLLRWSPLGYPIVPHLAKKVVASDDRREYTITLRKGVRWSDGHLVSTDDVMYWWENEVLDEELGGLAPQFVRSAGQAPTLEKIDDLTFKVRFEVPNGLFMERLAENGASLLRSPKHYLIQYHPTLGDQKLIEEAMAEYKLPSKRAVYFYMKDTYNPEHPRLWPWVYRSYKSNPPQVFVRNPYYFAVDSEGNQLPYIDRVQFDVQDNKMLALSAANGQVSMQTRHIRYENYTELMSRRKESGIRVLHWYPGCRSVYVINPNNTRKVMPGEPDTKWKAQLLADRRFRQALSLAIDRRAIIKAEYNNQVEPAQVSPGPESPFHHEKLHNAFVDHDPERASKMLDEIGLTGRDFEGYRTFPDDTRMTFYLDFCGFTGAGPAQFVVDDWGKVGVRVIPRERSRPLFYTEKDSMDMDFDIWTSESDFLPLCQPRCFLPFNTESLYAVGWGRWYMLGGFYGNPDAVRGNVVVPPKDSPIYHEYEIYEKALQAPTLDDQVRIFSKALDIAAENTWNINIADAPPQIAVVKEGFRNVPDNVIYGATFRTPGNAGIETFYFEESNDSPGAVADAKHSITEPTLRPGSQSVSDAVGGTKTRLSAGRIASAVIKYLILGCLALGLLMIALRHPFVGRRLVIMVPTLLIVSVVVFTIVQLPPGNYLTAKIMQLQESGDPSDAARIQDLKKLFRFDLPGWRLYMRWLGVDWFIPERVVDEEATKGAAPETGDVATAEQAPKTKLVWFQDSRKGLLQGNMGRSMETTEPVNEIVGDRVLLTFLISLGTILFTWATAIPIGIYSAVKQYSVPDYILTFVGFIGMCIPPFLLALILMALAGVSGLFSPEFAAQPEWTMSKIIDLMKHIWIPVIVLGVGGTAGMIRVMRANLLDELRKPYVVTARAKGVRPVRLLFKYPVRLALNPFISGIGALFPQLVSGGAIVAMVLSLPTVGPLMLQALFSEDMYLAASMLMVLSLLGIFGTLVSDLLLLWLDPRIRFRGGTR